MKTNLLTNLMVLLMGIVINLFMTPFYIKYVGIDGFGLLRITLLIPMYVNLATIVINGAVSRFLTINIQEKKELDANITFNTSFFSLTTIIILLVPILVYLALNITSIINVPSVFEEEAKFLFFSIFVSSQITVFSTLFLVPAYAHNRLDIQNYIKIGVLFLQTSLIIVIFIYFSSSLKYIGFSYIFAALIGLIFGIVILRKRWPYFKINIKFFSFTKFKELFSMGSWMFINNIGSILFLYVDLLIINHFFGSQATGEYAIGLQWSTLFRSFATALASVMGPIIIIAFAHKKFEEILLKSKLSVKYMGIIIALPIGIFLGFSEPFLYLWLGPEFIKLTPLLWLMLTPLVFNLAISPLFFINTSHNKVKIPGIVSIVFGLLNLFLAILMSVNFDIGIYGVAIASAIILTSKNLIFTPLYSSYILKIKKTFYYKYIFYGLYVFLFSITISYIISDHNIRSWIDLFLSLGCALFFNIIFIWFIILNYQEKEFLIKKIKRN